MYSFSYLEPVCCSMSSSNCCFLTCIQVSQEAGQVVWYSHLFQNFPQFIVMHTVNGFGTVNKADVFLDSLAFLMIQQMLAIWSLVPLPFLSYELLWTLSKGDLTLRRHDDDDLWQWSRSETKEVKFQSWRGLTHDSFSFAGFKDGPKDFNSNSWGF